MITLPLSFPFAHPYGHVAGVMSSTLIYSHVFLYFRHVLVANSLLEELMFSTQLQDQGSILESKFDTLNLKSTDGHPTR
jgi:hypothetical protein